MSGLRDARLAWAAGLQQRKSFSQVHEAGHVDELAEWMIEAPAPRGADNRNTSLDSAMIKRIRDADAQRHRQPFTVHRRHFQVGEDDVRSLLGGQFQRRLCAVGNTHRCVGEMHAQDHAEQICRVGLVVVDENCRTNSRGPLAFRPLFYRV